MNSTVDLNGLVPADGQFLSLMILNVIACGCWIVLLLLSRRSWYKSSWKIVGTYVVFALLCNVYFIIRLGGQANDSDTALMSVIIYSTQQTDKFTGTTAMYPHGLGYTAIVEFIVDLTGFTVASVQRLVMPFLVSILMPPIFFACYRIILKNHRIALFATLLILLQSDIMLVMWRGSHEMFTWMFGFASIASVYQWNRYRMPRFILVHLLFSIAMIATNYVFAAALWACLVLGGAIAGSLERVKKWRMGQQSNNSESMVFIGLGALNLLFTIIFARLVYTPASEGISLFTQIIDTVKSIFIEGSETENQYDTFAVLWWQNTQTYLMLTLINWSILLIASFWWLARIWKWYQSSTYQLSFNYWLLPAIGIEMIFAFIADQAGILGGNFVIRLFPLLFLISIPIAAEALYFIYFRLRHRMMIVRPAVMLLMAYATLALLIKVPNDPTVNTKWFFATTAEDQAIDWIIERDPNSVIWTGLDERFESDLKIDQPQAFINYDIEIVWGAIPRLTPQYIIESELEQFRISHLSLEQPFKTSEVLQLYDNGEVQIYVIEDEN